MRGSVVKWSGAHAGHCGKTERCPCRAVLGSGGVPMRGSGARWRAAHEGRRCEVEGCPCGPMVRGMKGAHVGQRCGWGPCGTVWQVIGVSRRASIVARLIGPNAGQYG